MKDLPLKDQLLLEKPPRRTRTYCPPTWLKRTLPLRYIMHCAAPMKPLLRTAKISEGFPEDLAFWTIFGDGGGQQEPAA